MERAKVDQKQQMKLIAEGHQERKINLYHALEKWNYLEMIQGKVDYLASQSQQTISLIMSYYQARYEQEMRYQQIPLPNLCELQSQNNYKTDESDKQIISTFFSLKELQDEKLKKSLKLAKTLKDIILKNLGRAKESYREIVFRLSEGIQETKSKLTKLESIVRSSKQGLQQAFENIDSQSDQRDFLSEAQGFLRCSLQQAEMHRTLAIETFNFWQKVNDLELQRQLNLKSQLQVTLQAEQEIGNAQQSLQKLLDALLEKVPESERDENSLSKGLRIMDVFTKEQLQGISQLFKVLPENSELWTFQMIKREFEGFDVRQSISIDKRLLTLKKFKCQQMVEQGQNSFLVESRLFITVDLFVIGFNYSLDYFLMSKPSFCVNLRSCRLEVWDQLSLEIKQIKPGFFLNKEISYLVKFKDCDSIEEFCKFVENLNIQELQL